MAIAAKLAPVYLQRSGHMDFGVLMFFTDYAISAVDLAKALEQRGFESVWAPEHSHIPVSRKTPLASCAIPECANVRAPIPIQSRAVPAPWRDRRRRSRNR